MQYFMKNPVLAIGLLMFGLFIFQVSQHKKWGIFHNDKLIATSCRAVLVKLDRKIPQNWKAYCEGNNLAVEIQEINLPESKLSLQAILYRQLANHMSFVAHHSHVDILEKVYFVRFKILHPKLEINAVTEGKYIVKLATLETTDHIMTHLKSTVQVNEVVK